MLRRLFTLASAASLLVYLAAVVLTVLSAGRVLYVSHAQWAEDERSGRGVKLRVRAGEMRCSYTRFRDTAPRIVRAHGTANHNGWGVDWWLDREPRDPKSNRLLLPWSVRRNLFNQPGTIVGEFTEVDLPGWHVAGAAAALPVLHGLVLARRARTRKQRARAGGCPACGYDLRATPGRCPECGAVPLPSHPTPAGDLR